MNNKRRRRESNPVLRFCRPEETKGKPRALKPKRLMKPRMRTALALILPLSPPPALTPILSIWDRSPRMSFALSQL